MEVLNKPMKEIMGDCFEILNDDNATCENNCEFYSLCVKYLNTAPMDWEIDG